MRSKIIGALIVSINLLCSVTNQLAAQQTATFDAVRHFMQIDQHQEGLEFLKNPERFGYRALGSDTTAYLIGKLHYHQKRINASLAHLTQVSQTSAFFSESVLFSGYQYAYIENFSQAKRQLYRLDTTQNTIDSQLSLYLLSGIALLERDRLRYDEILGQTDFSGYREIAASSERLELLSQTILEQKKKSALAAGLLSTVVPGLGQMYVGNIGRGAMTLVTTGIIGLQAWESYRKDGFRSVRFAIFGSLFSGFYLANIYGAAIGVRVHQQQLNDQLNESILVTMHVPLRYLFD